MRDHLKAETPGGDGGPIVIAGTENSDKWPEHQPPQAWEGGQGEKRASDRI